MNNYELIQNFLDIIKELAISNSSNTIDDNIIYTNLMGYNVTPEQQPYEDITYMWNNMINEYKDKTNLKVKQDNAFLTLGSGKLKGNEVKLYVPLDKNHIERGVKELIDFISSKNISYQIKISSKIRNDDISIRVNTLEEAEEILNFVDNNEYINEGLIKSNPFLPNAYGVGITMDNNYSYNLIISELISNYIIILETKDKLDELTVENLNLFIKEQAKNINDLDLKDIYDLLSKTTSKEFTFQDFADHANKKIVDKYDKDGKKITNPHYYLERAVKKTHEKYPDNSLIIAIEKYIEGDASYFTNDDNIRLGLIKYIDSRNVVNTMRNKLIESNMPIPSSNDKLINSYLNVILQPVNEKEEILKSKEI